MSLLGFAGGLLAIFVCLVLGLVFYYADELSDGNVGSDSTAPPATMNDGWREHFAAVAIYRARHDQT